MALTFSTRNPISTLTVESISDNLSTGTGYLYAASTSTIQFKAPGSATYGAAVSIADGDVVVCLDGDDATQFCVVSRDGTTSLTGTASIVVIGTLSTAERLAEVDDAISRTLRAISTRSGDESVQRETLASLREYRASLADKLAAEEGRSAGGAQVDLTDNF